jgi:hypothetical protein
VLPSRVSISGQLAPVLGSAPPSCPSPARGWTSRSSRPEALVTCEQAVRLLSAACTLFQRPNQEPSCRAMPRRNEAIRPAPSSRFTPLQRYTPRAAAWLAGFPRPDSTASSGFFRPLDALIRPEHPSLISCQSRSWGSPFRALFLAMQAASVSGAVALMPLKPPPEPRDLGRKSSQLS